MATERESAKVCRVRANPGASLRRGRLKQQGRAITAGLGSGLAPWVGARGAPPQAPIVRPSRSSLSRPRDFQAAPRAARRALARRFRDSSSLRSRSAKIIASSAANLSAGVTLAQRALQANVVVMIDIR